MRFHMVRNCSEVEKIEKSYTGTNEESGTSVFLVWSLTDACYGGGQIEFREKSGNLCPHPHRLT